MTQVSFRVETIELCGLHQGIQTGGTLTARVGSEEHHVLAAKARSAQRSLGGQVVDLEATIIALFPTELRACGVGLAVATSRVGSAVNTFLLPILVLNLGVRAVLALCAGVLATGGIVCFTLAPETRNLRLIEPNMVDSGAKETP